MNDSYWYVENNHIRVMCPNCAKTSDKKPWFWQGEKGYKSDLLVCNICKKVIFERKNAENVQTKPND